MKRGEIWIAALEPRQGAEVGKQRPVLIFQTNLLNEVNHPTCIILPISSKMQAESILRYRIDHPALRKTASFVLIDQIRTIDAESRLKTRIGVLPNHDLVKIGTLVKQVLDLST